MMNQISRWLGNAALVGFVSLSLFPAAQAQPQELAQQPTPGANTRPVRTEFDGRGVAHGAVFARGRNVNAALTINQGRFIYELVQPPGTRVRVRYQGAIARQNPGTSANAFTLDGRVQTFDSSASTRIFNNTTGTCRIEVFNNRVISSTCRSVAPDSTTEFLGLEQF